MKTTLLIGSIVMATALGCQMENQSPPASSTLKAVNWTQLDNVDHVREVKFITVNPGPGLEGWFRKGSGKYWVQYDQHDVPGHSLKEFGRDQWSIYLYDMVDRMRLQVDLHVGKVYLMNSGFEFAEIPKQVDSYRQSTDKSYTLDLAHKIHQCDYSFEGYSHYTCNLPGRLPLDTPLTVKVINEDRVYENENGQFHFSARVIAEGYDLTIVTEINYLNDVELPPVAEGLGLWFQIDDIVKENPDFLKIELPTKAAIDVDNP